MNSLWSLCIPDFHRVDDCQCFSCGDSGWSVPIQGLAFRWGDEVLASASASIPLPLGLVSFYPGSSKLAWAKPDPCLAPAAGSYKAQLLDIPCTWGSGALGGIMPLHYLPSWLARLQSHVRSGLQVSFCPRQRASSVSTPCQLLILLQEWTGMPASLRLTVSLPGQLPACHPQSTLAILTLVGTGLRWFPAKSLHYCSVFICSEFTENLPFGMKLLYLD